MNKVKGYEFNSEYFNGKNYIPFNYNSKLRLKEKVSFVQNVTNVLVGEHYNSVIRDLVFKYCLIEFLTDVDTDEIKESKGDINLIDELVNDTNIVNILLAKIDDNLIKELNEAINKDIEYKTGIKVNNIEDSIVKLVDAIEEKVKEINVNETMQLLKTISEMADGFTPDKVLESYAKSDMFKEKHKEALKNREAHIEKLNKIMEQNRGD